MTHLPVGQFLGQTCQSRRFGGLLLSETRYAPNSRLPPHSHENAYLCLVRRGEYTEYYGNRRRDCGPLTLAIHPPGEVHWECFHDQAGRSFNVEFAHDWGGRDDLLARVLETPAAFRGGELADLGLRLYREFGDPDAASGLAVEGLTLELLALVVRQSPTARRPATPAWLRRAHELLTACARERLTLSAVAAEVGVHPAHLATAFRRAYGCTPGEFVRRLRVRHAARELRRPEVSLAAVALAAGFADQSHFTRVFKRLTGLTPAAYRRAALAP